jgi:1-phosphofructokinase family hexose kinase
MIIILGLSPAVDITYVLDKLNHGEVNRVKSIEKRPGGKSVNVARVADALGGGSRLVLPLGGGNGRWIAAELARQEIGVVEISIGAETRQAVTVFDGDATVINEPASPLSESELRSVETSLIAEFDEANNSIASGKKNIFVISGSIPVGVSGDYIVGLIRKAEERGISSLVDVSGSALLAAASAKPFLLKPNREELIEATGEASVELAVARLQSLGAKNVFVTDGSNGSTWFSETGDVIEVATVQVLEGNPTGAGDASLAAMCVGFENEKPLPEILLDSAAAGAAAVLAPVAGEIDLETYKSFREQVALSK